MKLNAKITFVKINYTNSAYSGKRKLYIVSNDSVDDEKLKAQIDKSVKNLPEYDNDFEYTIEAVLELPTDGINSICLVGTNN